VTVIASGRRLGSRYRLEHRLGYGGMATVWLATDERLDRPVAIKVLSDNLVADQEYLERFRREARVAAGLSHPNLVSVYDYDAGERPYLVMEYVPGGDLAECARVGEPPDPHLLAQELLFALRHIHFAGVLHRDIKPQNVLVDVDGHARLTDFGIAQPRDATALTRTGHLIGTERYLAPEVNDGAPASERSDLYALGVVLAEVIDEGVDPSLRNLIERLRDENPELRPRSAAAALAELERGSPEPPGEPTQPYAPPAPPGAPADDPPAATEPFERSPSGVRPRKSGRGKAVAALAAGALGVAVAVAVAVGSGGEGGSGDGQRQEAANREGSGGRGDSGQGAVGESSGSASDAASESAPAAPVGEEPATQPADSAATTEDGFALNHQGHELNQQGAYSEAVPILQRAVETLRGVDETTYNYALYNLGVAYLGSGQPERAIPVLEERLQFDDGQLATVEATLAEAEAAAGVSDQ
jgi:serine/threonine-protein kinase